MRKLSFSGKTNLQRFFAEIYSVSMQAECIELLLPYMRAIRDRFRETVGLAVLDEAAATGVILAVVQETGRFGYTLCVGHRFPLHTGAPAKAILAFLPVNRLKGLLKRIAFTRFTRSTIASRHAFVHELATIRACGYALDRAEEVQGCHCLAVPVFDAAGEPVAGVWFTGPSNRLPFRALKDAYPELRAFVDQAQTRLNAHLKEQAEPSPWADKIKESCVKLSAEPFDNACDLGGVARSLGMSYSAFRHVFKAQIGTSPLQYRLACRIAAACFSLENTSLSLSAIALRTGFPSPAHFSTVFKKKRGLSPRDYRIQHQRPNA